MHPKKLTEIRRWLEGAISSSQADGNRLLVLSGPPGATSLAPHLLSTVIVMAGVAVEEIDCSTVLLGCGKSTTVRALVAELRLYTVRSYST